MAIKVRSESIVTPVADWSERVNQANLGELKFVAECNLISIKNSNSATQFRPVRSANAPGNYQASLLNPVQPWNWATTTLDTHLPCNRLNCKRLPIPKRSEAKNINRLCLWNKTSQWRKPTLLVPVPVQITKTNSRYCIHNKFPAGQQRTRDF